MNSTKNLFPNIHQLIQELDPKSLSQDRQLLLQPLIEFIQAKRNAQQEIRLNFICTHNSRRSHLSQIWAQAMASFYDIAKVQCYSAGTEATAIYPLIIETLIHQGFQIDKLTDGINPLYAIKTSINSLPIIGFSKQINNTFNPESEFAAIMTCDAAYESCPFVAGAEKRFPITFEDPKLFDNSPQQQLKYHESSLQIAGDMNYVFSNLN